MKNIIILGWFDRNNFGDDLYFKIYNKLLSEKYNLLLTNPEEIESIPFFADLVLIGGGDLINDYFMSKINPLIEDLTIPVYGFSVGFPYQDLENLDYVNNFDLIFSRNKTQIKNYKMIKIPDLVCLLPKFFPEKRRFNLFRKKTIGIFLAQPFFVKTPELLDSYSKLIEELLTVNCCETKPLIKLFSFNTHTVSDVECDLIPNHTLFDRFENENIEMVEDLTVENIQNHFYNLDLAICGRFHSAFLSILTNTPFIAVSPTRKVELLMKENRLKRCLIIPGSNFDVQKTVIISKNLLKDSKKMVKRLKRISEDWKKQNVDLQLLNLIESNFIQPKKQIISKVDTILKRVDHDLNKYPEFTAQVISFTLTSKIDSAYNWGIEEQIKNKNYNLVESIKWILEEEYKNKIFDFNHEIDAPLNLNYFDRDHTEGLHRSGWSPVMKMLEALSRSSGIAFDGYSDKTFGWKRNFYAKIGFLPIKQEWIGVFHHTSSENAVIYSDYNLVNYFNDDLLIDSLECCKLIIVFSTESKNWIKNRLEELNKKVDVINMFHPTESLVMRFSKKSFFYNPHKSVIQIGAWLRDTYAIFDLPKLDFLNKVALKGKLMENYYFNPTDFEEEESVSRGVSQNKYYEGMVRSIRSRRESVTIVEHLNNTDYDYLLSRNVVFLKLVDCAAVNTVLECIVRNTPIIVNRLPALEEYLGKDYPLFYNTQTEAVALLNSVYSLLQGHNYLKRMNKTRFTYNHFIEEFKCYI